MRKLALVAAASAALLSGPAIGGGPPAEAWEIGPIIRGRNYSQRMPLRPDDSRAGPSFAIPGPTAAQGSVHYLTVPTGPLRGARAIVLTYRIDAAPGTRFVPRGSPQLPATLSLYFQRAGDGWTVRQPDWRWPARAIVGGDASQRCISAASILAKEHRDRIMREHHLAHPHYGWSTNMGYGTPEHLTALRRHGPTPLHRRSFAPVAQLELI